MGNNGMIASICAGFIFGLIIGRSFFGDTSKLLSFELYIIDIRFGLLFASILGLISFVINYYVVDNSEDESKNESNDQWERTRTI